MQRILRKKSNDILRETMQKITRTYDSFGNIKSETFDSGTVSSAVSWNSSTKVMTETTTLPTSKNIVETARSGLPKTLEYDGTKLLQYNYGTGNVLSSIHKNFDSNNNHSAELDYTYNDWRRVSRRKEDFTSLNAPTVADYEYTYSKGLHLIGKQENTENRRTAYQYDSYYRLRRVDYNCAYDADDPTCIEGRNNVFKCNTAESGCEDFQLDGVHNIRSSYENQTNFAWTVDGFNRLEHKSWNNNTTTYSYDSNNNMIGEDYDGSNPAEIVYTYDKLNRLTSVANSDYLVEYSYDPFNRRTEKTVYYADGSDTYEQTHKYAYNDWDIISEEIKTVCTSDNPASTTAWELRRYVDHGTDNHIIMDTVSCSDDGNGNCSPNESTLQRIWFHKDERGNIIAISDGNGTIYERYRYRVYGEHEVLNADFTPKTTAAISPFLWGGSLYEPETNLYWMRNRYYHIDMHRFINQDPIGIWGDANNLGNGFAYVAGMVIEASDPTGLASVWETIQSAPLPDGSFHLSEEARGYIMESYQDGQYMRFQAMGPLINGADTRMYAAVFLTGKILEVLYQKYKQEPDFIDRLEEKFLRNAKSEEEKRRIREDLKKLREDIKNKQKEEKKSKEIDEKNQKENSEDNDSSNSSEYVFDPDFSDTQQNFVRNQFIKKILEMHERKSFFEMMEEEGPVIRYEDNGRKVFIFNPFYRGKDPMKQTYWKTKNADGTNGFVRNPFAPGAEYGYDSTTYEKWQNKGFIQTNVDPYFN